MKLLLKGCLILLLVAALAVVFIIEYGSPVSRGGLQPLHVVDHSASQPPTVSVDGGIISSGAAITSVSQHRKANCVVIRVRQGLILPNRRSGRFHLDVPVSNGVTEIAYGDPQNIIWHR